MKNISQSDVVELLSYDKETGVFSWSKKRRGVKVGKPLGTCNGNGYLRITVLGKSEYAHRLAWLHQYGYMPEQIDHINGIKSDNRISNLREATSEQNQWNKHGPQSNSESKTLGVSWHKAAKKWQAFFKKEYLGLFETVSNAKEAYEKRKQQLNPF